MGEIPPGEGKKKDFSQRNFFKIFQGKEPQKYLHPGSWGGILEMGSQRRRKKSPPLPRPVIKGGGLFFGTLLFKMPGLVLLKKKQGKGMDFF